MAVNRRFASALGISFGALVLMIVGDATPWYQDTGHIFEYLAYMDQDGKTCYYSDCGGSQVKAMYGLIMTSAIIATILGGLQTAMLAFFTFDSCSVSVPLCHSFIGLHFEGRTDEELSSLSLVVSKCCCDRGSLGGLA